MNEIHSQPAGFFTTHGPAIVTTVGAVAGLATIVHVGFQLKDRPKTTEFENMKKIVANHENRLASHDELLKIMKDDVKGLGVAVENLKGSMTKLQTSVDSGFSTLKPALEAFLASQYEEQVRHAVGGAGLTKAAFDNVPRQQPRRKQPARPVAARRSENRRTSAVS